MRFKIIIVEPKYQINIGYIARVSMNFGIGKLYFVKPRAKLTGSKAIMFSKHASIRQKSYIKSNGRLDGIENRERARKQAI